MSTNGGDPLMGRHGNPLFGDWGEVPRAIGAHYVDTPIGTTCIYCKEEVQDGDVGEMIVLVSDALNYTVEAVHRECAMLHIIGHEFGVCSCTNYAGCDTQREAALLCWQRVNAPVQE